MTEEQKVERKELIANDKAADVSFCWDFVGHRGLPGLSTAPLG